MGMKCGYEDCKRKISTFTTTECKCGLYFCNSHRLMMDHECTFTEKERFKHRKKIQDDNQVVKKDTWNLHF